MNVLHNSNMEYFVDLLSLPADYFEEHYFYQSTFLVTFQPKVNYLELKTYMF